MIRNEGNKSGGSDCWRSNTDSGRSNSPDSSPSALLKIARCVCVCVCVCVCACVCVYGMYRHICMCICKAAHVHVLSFCLDNTTVIITATHLSQT